MNKEKFNSLYQNCFDENHQIKACGRDACQKLLSFLKDPKYGNIDSGRLNIEEINKLYQEINS